MTTPPPPTVGLTIEVETWTEAACPDPAREVRTRQQVRGPGGATVTLTAGGATLLIEIDADGTCLITRVTSAPDDEGTEVYAGRLSG